MKVMNIIHDSIVDGTGLRTVVFFSGCPHRCVGCHNPQSWNINNGIELSVDEIVNSVLGNPMNDVTFSGGEPFLQPSDLAILAKKLKQNGKNIWCYTGYMYEDIMTTEAIKYIDVLVDGKFEIDKKDLDLIYKGSLNQRIIDVQQSIQESRVILLY